MMSYSVLHLCWSIFIYALCSSLEILLAVTNMISCKETVLLGILIQSDGSSDRSFMVDPLNYFSFQPVLHDWCNKGCGMCYPVCGMMHIKEPLLLIGKSSPCGGSGFLSHYLSGSLPYD